MKHLKQMIIKLTTYIDVEDKIVISELSGNFVEVFNKVEEYFDQKYLSQSTKQDAAKTRYNKYVGEATRVILKVILMPIFTKKCAELLEETKAEINSTNLKLSKTESELWETKSRLNDLVNALKANGLI